MPTPIFPELRVPVPEVLERIGAQIKQGREIKQSAGYRTSGFGFELPEILKQAQVDQVSWSKFTIDLLKTLFDDESIANEFGGWWIHYDPVIPKDSQLIEWMSERIRRLESIQQRVVLFAENQARVPVATAKAKPSSRDIFIVHGHDGRAKEEVARVIENLGLHAIILHEQPDKGRTVIEKFEHHSDVGFAVVLLTPDDMGYPNDEPTKAKPRARQNVVFELGYFIARLGRSSVCALLKGGIEMPTDYSGVLYTVMDNAGAWKFKLATEINAAGIDVDLNKLT